MLSIEKIKSVVSNLGQKYGVENAYLFGSYAKGKATEDSDVDLIIEKGDLNTFDAFSDFRYELVNELGTDVDLLTTESVKPRFYDLIKNDRVLIYAR